MTAIGSTTRSSRAIPLLVRDGLDDHQVETFSSQLSDYRVKVVDSVFEAIYETGTTRDNRPISSVIISERTRFEHRDIVNAFKTMDPGVRLILIIDEGGAGRIQDAVNSGFSSAIALPFRSSELKTVVTGMPEPNHPLEAQPAPSGGPKKTSNGHEEKTRKREIIKTERATRALEKTRPQSEKRQKLQTPATESTPSAVSGVEPEPEEIELIRSMVERGQVVEQALTLIEHRTGLEKLHFIPIEPSENRSEAQVESILRHDGTVVSVDCEHGNLGHLATEQTDQHLILAPWAPWLAQWILLQLHTDELEQMAWTDHLTGAGNRRALERILDSALVRASEEAQAVTVMYFDIDNFKQYNDRFGHEAGDNVLCETVQLLSSVIRRGDHVFRVGGDEFVVVFADPSGPRSPSSTPPESIEQMAVRFQQQVGNLQLPQIGVDAPGSLSISAGLVTYPMDGLTTRELLSKADKRALKSKRSGKDVITFGPTVGDFKSPPPKNQ